MEWSDVPRGRKEGIVNIVPPLNGLLLGTSPLLITPEYSSCLMNCYYDQRGMLILGRDGLVKAGTTSVGSAIRSIIGVPNPLTGVTDIYVSTDDAVYIHYSDSVLKICDTEGPAFFVNFHSHVFVCDGGQLKSIYGASAFKRGGHYNVIGEEGTTPDSYSGDNDGYTYVGNVFTTDDFYRYLSYVYVYIYNGGATGSNEVWVELQNPSTGAMLAKTETFGVESFEEGWTIQRFIFESVYTLEPNTDYGLVVHTGYDGSTSGSGISVGVVDNDDNIVTELTRYDGSSWSSDTSKAASLTVNSLSTPKPHHGTTLNSRLLLFADSENQARFWYSGVNDGDDFYYDGGYYIFGDSEDNVVNAGGVYGGSLFVSGYVRNNPVSMFYFGDVDALELQSKFYGGGAENWKTVSSTVNGLIFLDRSGILTSSTETELGDMRFNAMTKAVWSQLEKDIDWDTTPSKRFMAYIPKYGQVWFMPDWYYNQGDHDDARVYVYSLFNGAWTWFVFGVDITAAQQVSNTVYLGGSDGYLYKMDEDASDDDGNEFEVKWLTYPYVGQPFVNKLLRRYSVSLLGYGSSNGSATLKIFKDFDYISPVFSQKLTVNNVLDTNIEQTIKQHSCNIGFTALQFLIEDVSTKMTAGPITTQILTYGDK